MSKVSVGSPGSLVPPLWFLTLAAVFVLGWLAIQLKELCVLLVVAYCIAYLYQAPLAWCAKRRWSRSLSFLVITVAAAGTIVVLALTALPTLSRQFERLSNDFPSHVVAVKEWLRPFLMSIEQRLPEGVSIDHLIESPFSLLEELSPEALRRIGAGLWTALLGGYSLTLTILNLTLLPFIVFYLAVDLPHLHKSILEFFPGAQRKNIRGVAGEIDMALGAFIGGQILVGAILFLLYALGLRIVGVDLWFLLAVIAGFGNIIPYFGFIIGIVLSSIMAVITFGSFWAVLQVWVVFLVVQALEGMVITPRVVGDKTGLSPLLIILALFAGGQLFGILGVLLAVPGAAVIRVLGRRVHGWVLHRA